MKLLALMVIVLPNVTLAMCKIQGAPPLSQQFSSVDVALRFLKDRIGAKSAGTDTEYVGAIFELDTGYAITVGRGCAGQDGFEFRFARPAGARLVGLWHTHGAPGPFRSAFSPGDADTVRRTGVPFYLLTPQGRTKVLRPDKLPDSPRRLRLTGSRSVYAYGYTGSWL